MIILYIDVVVPISINRFLIYACHLFILEHSCYLLEVDEVLPCVLCSPEAHVNAALVKEFPGTGCFLCLKA